MSSIASHKWAFPARFRRHAFGWRSGPAITRVREAVSEIRKVARKDKLLAADGAVLFLVRLAPAIEQVDSSSGAIGTAVNKAIDALVPIIAHAPAEDRLRGKWLNRLWDAVQDDAMPYLELLPDRWGALCADAGQASHWADDFLPIVKIAWSPDPSSRGHFKGITACLSALHKSARHEELLDLLELAPNKAWYYRCWGVKALVALGRKADAIKYAEDGRDAYDSATEIAQICEEILLSSGFSDQAYSRYAVTPNCKSTYLATFRAVCRKYPHKAQKDVLRDLVASTPGEQGKWFAAAKSAGLFEEAIDLAKGSPCDARTLIRAARDCVSAEPEFALDAGLAALRWMAGGYGYEITGADVRSAFDYTIAAAGNAGCKDGVIAQIRKMLAEVPRDGNLVFIVLGRDLGLADD